MNRNALRVTTCCIASAIMISSGSAFVSDAATKAGIGKVIIASNKAAVEDANRVAGLSLDMSHYVSKTEDIVVEKSKSEYTDIAIAQVDNFVNVRATADAESGEVVGKLYNNSAATVVADEGDWYKIKSGNVEGFVKKEFVVAGNEELAKSVGHRVAKVNGEGLFVRESASTKAGKIGQVPKGDELSVVEEIDGWVKVSVEEGEGYVSSDFVECATNYKVAESKEEEEARLKKEEEDRRRAEEAAAAARRESTSSSRGSASSNSNTGSSGGSSSTTNENRSYNPPSGGNGQAVANYAAQFVGNPYKYGGASLTSGADCSGFVMSVYAAFGVGLPHSSSALRGVGYGVSFAEAQPGDIICYSGHVGIYAGNNTLIHASTAATGIKYTSPANYREILAVRRIF